MTTQLPPSVSPTLIQTLSIASALSYSLLLRRPPTFPRTLTKTLSTTLLSLLTFLRGSPSSLTTALAFGSLGDFFLASDSPSSFIRGLASFLVAHLFYIHLFARQHGGLLSTLAVIQNYSQSVATAGVLGVLVLVLITALVPRVEAGLRVPIVVYSGAIFTMAVMATAVEVNRGQVLTGALLFTASDAILAVDRFLVPVKSPLRAGMQHTVWVLYYSGQLMIALGF